MVSLAITFLEVASALRFDFILALEAAILEIDSAIFFCSYCRKLCAMLEHENVPHL